MSDCKGFIGDKWELFEVQGHFEIDKHVISISQLPDGQFTVSCKSDPQHRYANAVCRGTQLEAVDESYRITLTPGTPNVIELQTHTLPGSWTANDSGGDG